MKGSYIRTGLEIRPRWEEETMVAAKYFWTKQEGGVKYFWTEQGVRRIYFDQTGEGHILFFAALVNEDFLLHINGNN